MSYTKETIVINKPSEKLINLIRKMREEKIKRRDMMKTQEPMFTIQV